MDFQIIDAADFLSGEVKAKLEAARNAAISDESFSREVTALQSAVPVDVPIEQVDIRIGSTWVPTDFYESFTREVFCTRTKFFYSKATGSWDVRLLGSGKHSTNESQYGYSYVTIDKDGRTCTEVIPALHDNPEKGLFTQALHFKSPSVSIRKTADGDCKKDTKETSRALAKQEELQRLFSNWCKEGDRGEQLEAIYNALMNRSVLPNWRGRAPKNIIDILSHSGLSQKWLSRLRPYQLDSIWRMVIGGNTLLGLEVGLGKTIVSIAAAMLRKHHQTSIKALFVVQKSTLNQFHQTFVEAYPKARVLCATPDDCSTSNRQRLLAKATLWDWDAIILTHESFNRIPVRAATEIAYTENQLQMVEQEIYRLLSMGEQSLSVGKKRGNRVLKKLETVRSQIAVRLRELSEVRDSGIFFEDLSPDILVIDEAQKYKNGFITTKLDVSGINTKSSGRAEDFDLKLAHMRSAKPNGFLWLLTGTPEPTNSMVGVYTFQRYLQPEVLDAALIGHFDAWAMNFGRVVAKVEPKISGDLRVTERFSEFVNLPELLRMWLQSVHILRYDDVRGEASFVRPEPKFKRVSVPLSDSQLSYMRFIQDRYDQISKMAPLKFPKRDRLGNLLDKDGKQITHPITGMPVSSLEEAQALKLEFAIATDCHLLLYTDARKLMIAEQFIHPDLPVERKSKMYLAFRRIARWWRMSEKDRSVQLVFLDMGTPGGNSQFPAYNWLREQLLEHGIPAAEIAFIQDYTDDDKKEELFEKVNRGDVRILIGSTEPMGIGVNVQAKVKVVHLLDIPRRPDEYEQRLGRAIRYGNENSQVLVYQYLAQGQKGNFGADAAALQLLENKVKARESTMRADPTVRRLVEDDDKVLLYMMLKAHASGDARILRYVEVDSELEKASNRADLLLREVNRLNVGKKEGSIDYLKKQVAKLGNDVPAIIKDAQQAKAMANHCLDPLSVAVMGIEYKSNPQVVNDSLLQAIADTTTIRMVSQNQMLLIRTIGNIGGFDIVCQSDIALGNLWLQGEKQYKIAIHVSDARLIRNVIATYKEVMNSADKIGEAVALAQKDLDTAIQLLKDKRAERTVAEEIVSALTQEKRELQEILNMGSEN